MHLCVFVCNDREKRYGETYIIEDKLDLVADICYNDRRFERETAIANIHVDEFRLRTPSNDGDNDRQGKELHLSIQTI